ncbi:MAG: hypothetical protein HN742_04225 [Lentisphaerae bacterium]|jgi:hypothetical protein|nr:hypothetical protein [Lentisphaerota bacterium]MBT4819217.1 hypothetical protein [Lentisphaerota bacterium]MBT5611036.1 hypothetical protein [Lentisphaerota bacterium]MBT7053968.1 hypothetical protein [Lentisphaerota bacterium]MBT7841050.1 hypothetical protein [Lentisphaerota bacterium]
MQTIMPFPIAEVSFDPESVADALNTACSKRQEHRRVRGVCQVGEIVYFFLLPLRGGEALETYLLKSVQDLSEAGLTAMLAQRWQAGFDAVGTISLGAAAYYMLFAKPQG